MDPLSTAASVLTLLGACSQLTKFLIKVCNASKSADEDIQNILGQIQSLTRSTIRIQNLDKARSQYSLDHNTPGQQEFDTAWQCLNDDVITCNNVLNKILTRVEKIQKDAARYPDSVVKAVVALKLQFKESSFADLYKQLANSHRSIQATISAVQLQETWASRSLQIDFGEEASVQFSLLHRDIDELRLSLESAPAGNLRKSFAAAKAIAALGSSNKHFDVPQPISSIFTGCEARLKTLADLVFPSATNSENHSTRILQRRFIIHGLGGSGKTQFCCKFALENRNRYVRNFSSNRG